MASQTLQTIRNGWAPEIKRLNDNIEKLEASLSGTDECMLDLLHDERRQELNKSVKKQYIKTLKRFTIYNVKKFTIYKHEQSLLFTMFFF